jgi:hypothetical protein
MPQENVEVVRRGIDAFNARDLDRFMEDCDPDIELHSRFIAVASSRPWTEKGAVAG